MQDDLEDQTMTDDESYEDESCKRKKSSELNSSTGTHIRGGVGG